jgi:hypothetical protein
MTFNTDKTTSGLKVSIYINTSITYCPVGLDCHTNDNVCLDLQNCRYSVFIIKWYINFVVIICNIY